ncbi:zinc ribbon domain-containing protein [Pelagicoccus sp. NFK12]|uniref:Zinc ribbon domain-containing protein n=1 Tax=Pelagicoccus enzymogenes TaxID=2773457 RepID=A0A927IID9_9BACT|nr:zinc ribbon domain-containing protein [Pelagicoccus enzymogenes]MBD5780749.1 zinc ribbon domain-containing protein [Pelagicoccus enzymogenes]
MPLQRFRPISGRCKLCRGEVEIHLASNENAPEECPKCGQEIEACPTLTAPQMKINVKPSVSNAKSAGFKVFKKLDGGELEQQ